MLVGTSIGVAPVGVAKVDADKAPMKMIDPSPGVGAALKAVVAVPEFPLPLLTDCATGVAVLFPESWMTSSAAVEDNVSPSPEKVTDAVLVAPLPFAIHSNSSLVPRALELKAFDPMAVTLVKGPEMLALTLESSAVELKYATTSSVVGTAAVVTLDVVETEHDPKLMPHDTVPLWPIRDAERMGTMVNE